MKKQTMFLAAALFCGMATAAPAQPKATGLSPLDKTFMKDTAQSNLGELKYDSLVEKMAQRSESKQFARKMVQDHSKAQNELKALAAQKGFSLPSDTDKEEKEVIRRLAKEPKTGFDEAYKHEMIRDHTGDIAKTRREISLGRDPQVKAYAQKILPVLEMHLKLAKALPAGGRGAGAA